MLIRILCILTYCIYTDTQQHRKTNCPCPMSKNKQGDHFFWSSFKPKIFFNPHFLYIAARHPNNFFHKLCLSIALLGTGVYHHVTTSYAIEKPKTAKEIEFNSIVFFFLGSKLLFFFFTVSASSLFYFFYVFLLFIFFFEILILLLFCCFFL